MMVKLHVLLIMFWLWVNLDHPAHADPIPNTPVAPGKECSAAERLVVLSGDDLMPLFGTPVRQLALLKASPTGLTPIVFQVDRKDAQGRYIVEEADTPASDGPLLGIHDELVFVASDAGARLSDAARRGEAARLAEIRLDGTPGVPPGWVYVSSSSDPEPVHSGHYMHYSPASDMVSSATYQLGFNTRLPFLVDTFQWKTDDRDGWSPNVLDTMKIRHQGRFLGFIPFKRTHRDYTSRLTAVKAGPLRVIRRTESRIRLLWHLKTPAVHIDYVMMPGGFVMDTVIDIPFNVGLFFDGIETLTTVDWNEDTALPRLTIGAPGHSEAAAIDGQMSSDKHELNLLQANQFVVTSSLGEMLVSLEIPLGVPITPWLYLRDAQNEADPPENRVGQFGNVGFRTTGWEQINTEVQHVKFTVCLEPAE
jgi:hypothetical protein